MRVKSAMITYIKIMKKRHDRSRTPPPYQRSTLRYIQNGDTILRIARVAIVRRVMFAFSIIIGAQPHYLS